MASDIRTVEVFNTYDDGRWNKIDHFKSLKYGDIFRMYEPGTNELVKNEEGISQFIAQSEPTLVDNVFTVDSLPLVQIKEE